jgi:hypothetical protein
MPVFEDHTIDCASGAIEKGMPGFEHCENMAALGNPPDPYFASTGEGVAEVATKTLEASAPQVMAAINQAIAKVAAYVEQTEEFAVEQVPLLIQEILTWAVLVPGFKVGVALLLLAFAAWAWRWSFRGAQERLAAIREHTEGMKDARREANEAADQVRDQGVDDLGDVAFGVLHYGIPIVGGFAAVAGIILFFDNILTLMKPIVASRLYLIEYFRALAQ